MANSDRKVDVTRRDLGALLGVLGGAAGLAALTACAPSAGASEEATGTTSAALSGASFIWVDTIVTLPVSEGGPASGAGSGTNLRTRSPGSDSSSSSKPVAIVGGYYLPNDGGGGIFYWSNDTTAADDGGTIIVPVGNRTGCWKRLYTGPVNVRWFGANPSLPDNAPAIQAAILVATGFDSRAPSVPSTQPGSVFIPSGTYEVMSTITYVGGNGLGFAIRGEISGDAGASYGTTIRWSAAAPPGGTVVELRSFDASIMEELAIDGGYNGTTGAAIAVWYHSNQPAGGAPSDFSVFRRCAFVGVGGSASSLPAGYPTNPIVFLVGDYFGGTYQVSMTRWDDCAFVAHTSMPSQAMTAAACWRTAQGFNTCQFSFTHCSFGGAQYGIDWSWGGSALTILDCGFGTLGFISPTFGGDASCIKLGSLGLATVRGCYCQTFPEQSGASGGVRFVTSSSGGAAWSAATLLVEGCNVILTLPPDNIILDFDGKLTLIGNQFMGGFGSPSPNQNPPIIATGASSTALSPLNLVASTVFSLNNVYAFQDPGAFAPIVVTGGDPPEQALTGVSGFYGGSRQSIWSIGDSTVNSANSAFTPLQPWFGVMPRTGLVTTQPPQWSANPVPAGGFASWVFNGGNGPLYGVNVGDAVILSIDSGGLPAGVVISGVVTNANEITVTALNMTASDVVLTGNVIISVHPRTFA